MDTQSSEDEKYADLPSHKSSSESDDDDRPLNQLVVKKGNKGTRKRRARPTATPKTTPSPKPKEAPSTRKPDEAKPQARQPAARNQSETTRNRKESTTTQPTTGSMPDDMTPAQKEFLAKLQQSPEMREYTLQTAIRAVGGRTIVSDARNQHKQFRYFCVTDGHRIEGQRAPSPKEHPEPESASEEPCPLELWKWGDWPRLTSVQCTRCKKSIERGEHGPEMYSAWSCACDGCLKFCFQCIPVILKTQLLEME